MKKTIELTLLILGAFIGASFSSGREIYVYFAKYGWVSIPIAIAVGVVLYFVMYFFLNLKIPEKKNKHFVFFEIVLLVATFVLSATMFAGCREISYSFGGNIIIIVTLLFALLQCFVDIKGLQVANYILMPMIFISLIVCIVLSDFEVANNINTLGAVSSSVKYLGTNCILLSIFLMQIGNAYTKRQKKVASFFVATILTIFIILISLVLMAQPYDIQISSMPLVFIAFSKNVVFGKVLCMVVWFGLITTLLSGLFVVCNYVKKNNRISKILLVLACFGLSFVGWEVLTSKIYSAVGLCSIFAIFTLLITYSKSSSKT